MWWRSSGFFWRNAYRLPTMRDSQRQALIFLAFAIVFTGVVGVVEESVYQDDGLPSFVSVPTKIKTTENDTVVLPCYVENLGDNRVQWWRGDMLLADSHGSSSMVDRVKMGPNNGLEVATVIADDHGEYECRVERPPPWDPLVQKHTIEVLYNPTVSLSPPGPVINVTIGEDVVITCDAYAYPTPTVTWSHQANLPEDSISLTSFSSSKLTFKASSRTFSGLYTCTANNGVGSPVSATVRLRILHPPEVSVEREWVHASPGIRAELTCIVIAEPPAKVVWSRGKHPISTSQRISRKVIGNRHSLLFQKVIPHDLTSYSCTATNALGSDQRTVLLTGVAREAVFKSDLSSAEEDTYTLIWEVESYTAIINFKLAFRKVNPDQPSNWTELVIPADGASALVHSKRFTLRGLSRASTYEAVVRSRNEYGWSPPSEVFPFTTKGGSSEQIDTTEVTSTSEDVVEGDSGADVEEVEEKAAIQSAIPRPHWSQAEATTILPQARSGSSLLMPSIFLIFIAPFAI